jgi:tRNA(His) 5'-end guanylyltransferase
MIECTKYLVAETHALCGYTQSDEITLTWHYINPKTEPIFSGRISKIISTLAAMQSVYFNKYMHNYLDAKYCNKIITFDCRVWNVPNIIEGANAFLWREQDATKNSISMAARSYYSHKQLHKKNGAEMQDMLHKVGVNWNDYPSFFKRGTYLMPKLINVNIDELNIDEAKKKYILESNPSLQYQRRIVSEMDLPPLSQVVNRADFIYSGSEPKLFTQ